MSYLEPVTRTRLGATKSLPPALFAPEPTAPATDESSTPVVPAPTLYWFNEWPDVVDTDLITVRGVTYEVSTDPSDWRGSTVGGLVVRLRTPLLPSLAKGRAYAESRMTETVVAGLFADGVGPTGAPTRVLVTSRYSGKGQIEYPTVTVAFDGAGPGAPLQVQNPVLKVPVGSSRIFEGDEVEVSASIVDSILVGRRYRIEGAPQAGQTTAHRYPLVELN